MKYSPNLGGGEENFYNYTTNDNKNVCFNKNGTYVYTLYYKILCKTNLWNNFTSLFFHNFFHHFTEPMIYIQCSTSF